MTFRGNDREWVHGGGRPGGRAGRTPREGTTGQNARTFHPKQTSGPAAEPTGGRQKKDGAVCESTPNNFLTYADWMGLCWMGDNGQPGGHFIGDGSKTFLMDSLNNITFATGRVSDGSPGSGVFTTTSADHIVKTGTYHLHAKGPQDSTRKASDKAKSGENAKDKSAISLYGEGEIAIESTGDDVGIKGDNIVINAVKTLTLKAGEAINIECGDGNGKTSLHTGDYNINTAFINETVTGGKHTDGSGEVCTNQTLPGSKITSCSSGSHNHVMLGNYSMGLPLKGHYNVDAGTNINFQTRVGGFGFRALIGDWKEQINGQKVNRVMGIPFKGSIPNPAAWTIHAGPGKASVIITGTNSFWSTFGVGVSFLTTAGLVTVNVGGILSITGTTIFLN